MSSHPPHPKILVRAKEGISLLAWSPGEGAVERGAPPALLRAAGSTAQFSPDGSMVAVTTPEFVRVLDTGSGEMLLEVAMVTPAAAVAFSPKGTYLQIFRKPNGTQPNLTVQRIRGGDVVLQQPQKVFSKAAWPSVQISEDENTACRVMTAEIQFYDCNDWAKGPVERLRVPGMSGGQMALAPASHVAVHIGEAKGAPASVRIFARPFIGTTPPNPCARRSFYKANTVKLIWNHGSTGVLALAHSDVDKTNQSYYGDSSLHYLASDGTFEGAVPLGKDGPIHDVQWASSGKEFCVVHGYMPAKTMLFDSKCRALFDFGSGPRNIVRWSPYNRYICLAGFGNLPGDVEWWDRQQLKRVGAVRAAMGVSIEWAPTGQHCMVATTAPRLQVDNGIRIYGCDGTLFYTQNFSSLFQAEWQPAAEGAYPDEPYRAGAIGAGGSGDGASPAPAPVAPPKPVAAYRPPNMAAGRPSAVTAMLSGARDGPRAVGAAKSSLGGGESKSAAKNRKRREKKEAEKGSSAEAGERVEGDHEDGAAAGEEEEADGASDIAAGVASLATPSASGAAPAEPQGKASDAAEGAKRLRALHKKLRQLEELKKKGAASLTAEQRDKLKQEKELLDEIASLESSH
eukprot:TRINITY_DN17941_c0_g1_i1.p1 TRINITY_DN17941_c0_g1~~TRINITY_DN17941_c0_g1_i1.p1  ORF type:complete len:626 (+),score=122.31 TRINITY_DN17941_c0_g1_i1:276-2153(+)